jgi:hypothetical protein
LAEFQVNDTVNTTTGLTPFFADLGYHPRSGIHPGETPRDELLPTAKADILRADEILRTHKDLVSFLRVQMRWAQEAQAEQANKSRRAVPKYKVGDRVFVNTKNWSITRPSRKLANKWEGPWAITRIVGSGHAFELDLPHNMIRRGIYPVFHPDMLRDIKDAPLPYQDPRVAQPVHIAQDNGTQLEEWLVDGVLDFRKQQKTWEYLIKWMNSLDTTWEPAAEWLDCYETRLFHWQKPEALQPLGFVMPGNWVLDPDDL